MFWPVVSLIVNAVILRAVAAVTSTLQVENWGAALLAAFGLGLVQWGLWALAGSLMGPMPQQLAVRGIEAAVLGVLLAFAELFVVNTISLAIVTVFVPGVALRGIRGLVLAGVLLTIVGYVGPQLLLAGL